jgi:quinolinate synthase
MKMNDLERLAAVLAEGGREVVIDESIRRRAERSIRRMVEFGQRERSSEPARAAG